MMNENSSEWEVKQKMENIVEKQKLLQKLTEEIKQYRMYVTNEDEET